MNSDIQNDFRTLTNICFPTEPGAKTFKQLCDELKLHFSPVVSLKGPILDELYELEPADTLTFGECV